MMQKLIKEFQDFALRGNVIDLAIGVVIGSGFGKIVKSLVNDIIMPLVGILVGGINFQHFKIILQGATKNSPAVTLNIGNFLQNTINFLIVAITVFIAIKLVTSLYVKKEEAVKPPKKSAHLLVLEEIRNLLKNHKK